MKWAVQLNLSLDHVPGAAAAAQKEETGGTSGGWPIEGRPPWTTHTK